MGFCFRVSRLGEERYLGGSRKTGRLDADAHSTDCKLYSDSARSWDYVCDIAAGLRVYRMTPPTKPPFTGVPAGLSFELG